MNLKEVKDFLESKEDEIFELVQTKDELSWKIPCYDNDDDNKSFTHTLTISESGSGQLFWEGNTIPSGGEYFMNIENLNDFKVALEDWDNTPRNWNY